ncbi:MAG: MlaD family protein [Bacteroidota bacterium]
MKNTAGYKWKLGLFVALGFVLFVAAIFYIGQQKNMFGSTFRIRTQFKSVSGLMVGNNVRFSGINVGTVEDIRILTDTSVLVTLILEKDVQKFIKSDATASIASEGLMGDRMIAISPGSSGDRIADNGVLRSLPPVETDAIITSLQVTSENAEIITTELADMMFKINNGKGAIGKLLNDEGMARDLGNTMNNLEKGSEQLNQNMEAVKSNVLLRGYFKKKKAAAEQQEEERQKELEKAQKKAEKEAKREARKNK